LRSITARLGTMRRAVEWTVYPPRRIVGTADFATTQLIQSSSRICEFDAATGQGRLSAHRANGAYGIHLSPLLGATTITVPPEVIADVLAAQPRSGDRIGPGVYIA
jgi:hypothetical protein